MEDDAPLVYSTDPAFRRPDGGRRPKNKRFDRMQNKPLKRFPEEPFKLEMINAFMRIEKSGRAGKTVTVVDRLPRAEKFLSMLCRDLKSRCGTGGKYGYGDQGGFIEIQGDQRDVIRRILIEKSIQCKG